MIATAASLAGRADLPRQVVEPMQRQLKLLQEVVERERRMQRELATLLVAPIDAVFDLLEESGATLRRQAKALQLAGHALEQTAGLMLGQAELLEQTVTTMRQPAELAKAVAGIPRRPRPRKSSAARKPAARKTARKSQR